MNFEQFEWELLADDQIQDDIAHYTYRAKVLGGWLVKCTDVNQSADGELTSTSCVAFIKDITHEWKLPQYQ